MTHQQILEKAITKAIEGGWDGTRFMDIGGSRDWLGRPPEWRVVQPFTDPFIVYTTGGVDIKEIPVYPEHILFDHDFAKALWGDKHDCDQGYHKKRSILHNPVTGKDQELNQDYVVYCLEHKPGWQHHLQQMVIAEDPIQYLGKHL